MFPVFGATLSEQIRLTETAVNVTSTQAPFIPPAAVWTFHGSREAEKDVWKENRK